jgi:hypothetical protein
VNGGRCARHEQHDDHMVGRRRRRIVLVDAADGKRNGTGVVLSD